MGRRSAIPACRLAAGLGILAALAAALSGCASARGERPPAASRTVRVDERDFRIEAPRTLAAGHVTLQVKNQGPSAHELLVVRAPDDHLPLRRDGLTVDEDAVEPVTAGALEPGKPRSVRRLDLRLAPGHYVLFCNMSGHYLGGMYTELEVK